MNNIEKITPVRRALLSVTDKTGLVPFASQLEKRGVELISTGGTSEALQAAGIQHRQVEDITGLKAMLDGRVKTLHPAIHGGILGKRDKHAAEAEEHHISWIDLVVVNFYPFAEAIKNPALTFDEAIEYIDIGGPTMVRAAAKNAAWVGVVVDPSDYEIVLNELNEKQGLSFATKKYLAQKVFTLTADYDATIRNYFMSKETVASCPQHLALSLNKVAELRYGENPHQQASVYQLSGQARGILAAKQHQGKPLSYNNMLDAEAAYVCVNEFTEPTGVIVKHANPCGVASALTIKEAYQKAYAADALSAFGGIVALNRPCDKETAEAIVGVFTEVVLAPEYTEEALSVFSTKPNLRVLALPHATLPQWEMRYITGGMLMQEKDVQPLQVTDLQVVTNLRPTSEELTAMLFAWRVLKHIKSNAILLARDNATVGIGAGQVSRVDAVDLAIRKAGEQIHETILASDAFFPFRDSIDRLADTGVRAIIQPGGSVRDEEVISACNEHGIAMVFTAKRCFRH